VKTISLNLAFLDKSPTLKFKKIKPHNAFNNKSKIRAQMNENSFFSFWQPCRQTEGQDKKKPTHYY
jgi:hypothetical protein